MSTVMKESRQLGQVLEAVDVKAKIEGLMSEVTVTQVYVNPNEENIEAVYTIPLPMDALLLELKVRLNDEELVGTVKGKNQATRDYEEAIEDGDSAVLLEYVGDGLYSVNVGNLMSGERAEVMFRYAQLHQWQGENLRFYLPTTVAPRYGDPLASGFAPHQVPEVSFAAENKMSFELLVEGQLSACDFECPSHPIKVSHDKSNVVLSLSGDQAFMDRDLVINFRQSSSDLSLSKALIAKDRQGHVGLASFHLSDAQTNIDDEAYDGACIKIVVDCSGSMSGDSIRQAGKAVEEILQQLKPNDYFNITLFGSEHKLLFKKPLWASDKHVKQAIAFVSGLQADLGGTEIGSALKATVSSTGPVNYKDNILLITDGEVYDHEAIIDSVLESGHRVFAIGVGSSVSEHFIEQIARKTGGASELVSPRENMAERIVRQFNRIKQPEVSDVSIKWPVETRREYRNAQSHFFLNDTLHVFAWFDEPKPGDVSLSFKLGNTYIHQSMNLDTRAISDSDELSRLAAGCWLKTLDEDDATEVAVDYQLVTENTSCVLVKVRADNEKAEKLPALKKVDQMLAAGWGGTGSVSCCMSASDYGSFDDDIPFDFGDSASFDRPVSMKTSEKRFSKRYVDSASERDMEFLDIPAFLRRQDYDDDDHEDVVESIDEFIAQLNELHERADQLEILTMDDLIDTGLPESIVEVLQAFIKDQDVTQTQCVILFLYQLGESDYTKTSDRQVKRLVRRRFKGLPAEVTGLLDTLILDELG